MYWDLKVRQLVIMIITLLFIILRIVLLSLTPPQSRCAVGVAMFFLFACHCIFMKGNFYRRFFLSPNASASRLFCYRLSFLRRRDCGVSCCLPFNLKLKPSTSQPTHFREVFRKSSHHVNTNKGSISKQSGNDVEGCRSQKVLFQSNMRVFLQYSVKS